MLDYNDSYIREHMAHTPHHFPGDKYIDRDFGEAQTEISAGVADTTEGALAIMHGELSKPHARLKENGELLWPSLTRL